MNNWAQEGGWKRIIAGNSLALSLLPGVNALPQNHDQSLQGSHTPCNSQLPRDSRSAPCAPSYLWRAEGEKKKEEDLATLLQFNLNVAS